MHAIKDHARELSAATADADIDTRGGNSPRKRTPTLITSAIGGWSSVGSLKGADAALLFVR